MFRVPVLIKDSGWNFGSNAGRFWKYPVGNCLKTTSERLQSSPVTPLQSLKKWRQKIADLQKDCK